MAKELGCNPKTINPVLERLGIEYAGNQSGKGTSKASKKNYEFNGVSRGE